MWKEGRCRLRHSTRELGQGSCWTKDGGAVAWEIQKARGHRGQHNSEQACSRLGGHYALACSGQGGEERDSPSSGEAPVMPQIIPQI